MLHMQEGKARIKHACRRFVRLGKEQLKRRAFPCRSMRPASHNRPFHISARPDAIGGKVKPFFGTPGEDQGRRDPRPLFAVLLCVCAGCAFITLTSRSMRLSPGFGELIDKIGMSADYAFAAMVGAVVQ